MEFDPYKIFKCIIVSFEVENKTKRILFMEYDLSKIDPNSLFSYFQGGTIFGQQEEELKNFVFATLKDMAVCKKIVGNNQIDYLILFSKSIRNDSSFLGIIGHELGHIFLDHLDSKVKRVWGIDVNDIKKSDERDADDFSVSLTGIDPRTDLHKVLRQHYYECCDHFGIPKILRAPFTFISSKWYLDRVR